MLRHKNPKGVHPVKRMRKDGFSFHFYAWRGGPKFYESQSRFPNEPEFYAAFAAVIQNAKPEAYMTDQMVNDFLTGPHMPKGERTREDYRKFLLKFAEAFGDDPAAIFDEPESRAEVNKWREQFKHSPKQYDYAGAVVTRLLNWAWKDAGLINQHHCSGFKKIYKSDRSEIVWTSDQRQRVVNGSPLWVGRILIAACETGLRVSDLIKLTWQDIEATPQGRRIRVRTNKRKQYATIPVTPEMDALLVTTPREQKFILSSATGKPLTKHRASEGVRQWRDKVGLTPDALGYDLRLQDARGTAATRLLNAGLSLREIASHMGWGLRHAANVIEHYARIDGDETDAVLAKILKSEGGK